MKKLIVFLLLSSLAFGQNFARMITGVNQVTPAPSYTFVPQDATRLTAFTSSIGTIVTLLSPANVGFGAGTMFSVLNSGSGTVTINCTACLFFSSSSSGSSSLALSAGQGADIYSTGLNYFVQGGSGTGGGGGGVTSFTGGSGAVRTGGVAYQATDPGSLGIQQVGTGTLGIFKNPTGSLRIGDVAGATNSMLFGNDSGGGIGFTIGDVYGNSIFTEPFAGGNNIFLTAAGNIPTLQVKNTAGVGEIDFNMAAFTGGTHFGVTSSLATFDMPVNFGGAGAFQLGGSFGLNGQVPCSTGSGVAWSSSCGAASGVTTVGFTANQTKNTGSAGSPVVAITNPFNVNDVNLTQGANGDDTVNCIRNTDTLPTGTCFKVKTAGGLTLSYFDISGNLFANSFTGTGGGAAYLGLQQGSDNCTAAVAAFSVNGICEEAPASVGTSYTVVRAANGPGAASLHTYTALSSGSTTESFTPATGNSAHIQTADATVAGAASGVIATFDGAGNAHSSGINISTVLPSVQGPSGGAYTNAANNVASTVMTYSNSIPASTTVLITCIGSYKFTTAVNTAEFALNFTSAPTNLFLNVEIGGNATTGTHTYGRQTTNGALVSAGIAAAATGTYYPVTISGGVTTNAATTFTIQGAQATAVGSSVVNVDQNGFTCSVK